MYSFIICLLMDVSAVTVSLLLWIEQKFINLCGRIWRYLSICLCKKDLFIFILWMSVCLNVHKHIAFLPVACGRQKIRSQDLELQTDSISPPVFVLGTKPVSSARAESALTSEPSSLQVHNPTYDISLSFDMYVGSGKSQRAAIFQILFSAVQSGVCMATSWAVHAGPHPRALILAGLGCARHRESPAATYWSHWHSGVLC